MHESQWQAQALAESNCDASQGVVQTLTLPARHPPSPPSSAARSATAGDPSSPSYMRHTVSSARKLKPQLKSSLESMVGHRHPVFAGMATALGAGAGVEAGATGGVTLASRSAHADGMWAAPASESESSAGGGATWGGSGWLDPSADDGDAVAATGDAAVAAAAADAALEAVRQEALARVRERQQRGVARAGRVLAAASSDMPGGSPGADEQGAYVAGAGAESGSGELESLAELRARILAEVEHQRRVAEESEREMQAIGDSRRGGVRREPRDDEQQWRS